LPEKTLLVVDDSPLSRMMVKSYAEAEYPDWSVFEASNAIEATELSDKKNFDYMTIDYNMPGMDGLTLIHQLRDSHPRTKIALLTGSINADIQKEASELGIHFIQKPITQAKIVNYLKN